jgi:putative zinc finger/helix-turn-helix YgiT family protein
MRPWEGSVRILGVDIHARGKRCRSCSETLFDEAEVERQERAVADAIVERGIRTGPEFKLVRKLAGFRANEVAEMFGVRPETVSRWERDEVELPRTAAYALGELYEHPKVTRQKLEAFAR